MTKSVCVGVIVGAIVGLGAVPANAAGVNCEQVRKYLATGRTAEQIAESMIVDVSEVKKCQEANQAGTTTPTPGAPK